ncbi:hypothetical protein RJ641_031977 [Dillenia turbinata]|uniref:Uncharacterized protein n=1 Tax=Dillenia turbinata TaxID=194707 RepID=A0AAN8VR18_9MAGN
MFVADGFYRSDRSVRIILLHLLFVKVEGDNVEAFMSERATQFSSTIGLLGEYCPTSRKKQRHSFGCMHLEPFWDHHTDCHGCHFTQPFPSYLSGGLLTARYTIAAF